MDGEADPRYIVSHLTIDNNARMDGLLATHDVRGFNEERPRGLADIFNLGQEEHVHVFGDDEAEEAGQNRRNAAGPRLMPRPARAENLEYRYNRMTTTQQRDAEKHAIHINNKVKARQRALIRKRQRLGIGNDDAVDELFETDAMVERRKRRRERRQYREVVRRNRDRARRREEQQNRRNERLAKRPRTDDLVDLFDDGDNGKGEEQSDHSEESSEEELFSDISSDEQEGDPVGGATASDESDSDAVDGELMDPEDIERQLWARTGKVTTDCEVCRQIARDPYGASMVGKIQKSIFRMFDRALSPLGGMKPEMIIDQMVRANNTHVVRPVQSTRRMAIPLTSLDWYQHFGVTEAFSKRKSCVTHLNLEMYKSTMIYKQLEAKQYDEHVDITHEATGRSSLDTPALRDLAVITRMKIYLMKESLALEEKMLRVEKLRLEKEELEGVGQDESSLFLRGGTSLAGSAPKLHGMSMAEVRASTRITSETIYRLTAREG